MFPPEFLKGPGKPHVKSKEYNYQPRNTQEVGNTSFNIYNESKNISPHLFEWLIVCQMIIIILKNTCFVMFTKVNKVYTNESPTVDETVQHKHFFSEKHWIKPGFIL